MASVSGPNRPETFHNPDQGSHGNQGFSGYFRGLFGMGHPNIEETRSNPGLADPASESTAEPSTPQGDDWTFGLFSRPSTEETGGMTRNQTWAGFSLFGNSQSPQNSTTTNQKPLQSSASSHELSVSPNHSSDNLMKHGLDRSEVDRKKEREDETVTFTFFTSDSESMDDHSSKGDRGRGIHSTPANTSTQPSVQAGSTLPPLSVTQKSSILSAYQEEIKRTPRRHFSGPLGGIAEQSECDGGLGMGSGSIEAGAKVNKSLPHHRRHIFDSAQLRVNRKEMNMMAPTSS